MRRKIESLKVRVNGAGAFPIDMLRYDAAYPASEADSSKIIASVCYKENSPVEVVVTANGCPNAARWRSFGWTVTHVWTGYEWQGYSGETVRK